MNRDLIRTPNQALINIDNASLQAYKNARKLGRTNNNESILNLVQKIEMLEQRIAKLEQREDNGPSC